MNIGVERAAPRVSKRATRSRLRQDGLDEALTMLDQALTRIEQFGERMELAEILRLKGEVLLMHNRSATVEAENCFRVGLAIAHAQEAKWWDELVS